MKDTYRPSALSAYSVVRPFACSPVELRLTRTVAGDWAWETSSKPTTTANAVAQTTRADRIMREEASTRSQGQDLYILTDELAHDDSIFHRTNREFGGDGDSHSRTSVPVGLSGRRCRGCGRRFRSWRRWFGNRSIVPVQDGVEEHAELAVVLPAIAGVAWQTAPRGPCPTALRRSRGGGESRSPRASARSAPPGRRRGIASTPARRDRSRALQQRSVRVAHGNRLVAVAVEERVMPP